MKLNLFFQRKDVDIGIVQVNVDTCLKDLDKLLKEHPLETSYLHKLELNLVPETKLFKGHHAIVTSKYQAVSCRDKFISALNKNITNRFPEKQLISMCILGLRPVTLLDDEQLAEWGNASIKTLADHFGNKKTHSFTNDGEKVKVSSEPLIDYNESMEKWQKLKTVVKTQGYPRDATASLWALLAKYHKDDFPNITKLAMLALTDHVHTCDCERSFSAQNSITTPLRNRISSDHCDMLMRVMIKGPGLCNFD